MVFNSEETMTPSYWAVPFVRQCWEAQHSKTKSYESDLKTPTNLEIHSE